ncbi:hypothetical protein Pma05_36730 [Plantactinospora mayteni]|uniref:Uncharacterized protein n=1 Tax=Plantactinospora mayteni TaxID=566021 RepID=A0ABQ4ER58_9ACTN|nr:hypothetical protein Pma05_36730 [Plantactinospora mayteni]
MQIRHGKAPVYGIRWAPEVGCRQPPDGGGSRSSQRTVSPVFPNAFGAVNRQADQDGPGFAACADSRRCAASRRAQLLGVRGLLACSAPRRARILGVLGFSVVAGW